MICRRCRIKMSEEPGTHHKQKRWRCKQCGRRRMEAVALKRRQAGRKRRKNPQADND